MRDQLFRGGCGDAEIAGKPVLHAGAGRIDPQPHGDRGAQAGEGVRQGVAACRRLAEPERDAGRLAVRVLHPHDAALDAPDAIAGVAELEHVAGQALDREILVDAADHEAFRFQNDLVVGGIGDGAAGRQRRQPRAAPAAQHVVDRVVMDQRPAPAAAGGEALGQHAQHGGEVGAIEGAIRPGAAEAFEQRRLRPVLRRDLGHDLLRQHIERLVRHRQQIELAAAHAVEQGDAFAQLVAREREQPSLRRAADGVAGAADPLQEARDRARRADLTDQVDIADVDAEFQRRRRHQRPQRAGLEPLLRRQPLFLRHAAMVRGHRLRPEPIGQLPSHPFGHAAGVDEHEGGAVRGDQRHQPVVHLFPDLGRHHCFQRLARHFQHEVARALVAGIDDRRVRRRRAVRPGADQEVRDRLDRVLRRRQPDPLQPVAAQRGEAFERQGEVAAALARRDGVDLVHDHRAGRRQHGTAGGGAKQDVERFRRGDEDMRRPAAHAVALGRRGVAGAHPGADLHVGQAARLQLRPDAGQRRFQVALDVVGQRLQRRDVEHLGGVGERPLHALADQRVDRREEGGQGLAGAGGGGNQGVPAGLDGRPGLSLRRGGRGEAAGEPGCDGRVKQPEGIHGPRGDRVSAVGRAAAAAWLVATRRLISPAGDTK